MARPGQALASKLQLKQSVRSISVLPGWSQVSTKRAAATDTAKEPLVPAPAFPWRAIAILGGISVCGVSVKLLSDNAQESSPQKESVSTE